MTKEVVIPAAATAAAALAYGARQGASNAKDASLTPKLVGSAWIPWVRPAVSVWT